MNTDLTQFKRQIFKYALLVALIAEVVSLPILGLNLKFTYGLVIGTAISIVNFTLMEATLRTAMTGASAASIIIVGYMVRLAFYGVSFYTCIKTSYPCGVGVVIGFVTIKIAIYYLHGFKAKFSTGRVVREEPENLEIKKHWYDYKEDEEKDLDSWDRDDWDYKNFKKKEK